MYCIICSKETEGTRCDDCKDINITEEKLREIIREEIENCLLDPTRGRIGSFPST